MAGTTAPPAAPPARALRSDAARNRDRIVRAASAVFAERGTGVGVDEVARAAGVGVGTLYRRFPTKDALIDAVVRDLLEQVVALARTALDGEPGRGIEAYLTGVGEVHEHHEGCLAHMWGVPLPADLQTELRPLLRELLRRDQAAGTVREEITPEDLTMLVWAMTGVARTAGAVVPGLWRRTLELLLAGLRPGTPLVQPPMGPRQRDRVLRQG